LFLALAATGCATTDAKDENKDEKSVEDQLIEKNEDISRMIDAWAEKLDLYLANDRFVEGPNKSRLTFYNAFTFEEGGERRYSPHAGAKLHLPNLQEKLALNFSNYDEDQQNRGINESRYQTTPSEKTYTTSLSLLQDIGQVKTEFRPLLEFTDRIETSYLFRFFSKADFGDFRIEPELQLFARSDTGTGEFFALDFGYTLTDDDDLMLINQEQYTDGDNTLSTNHGVKWKHAYDSVRSQETGLIFESNNRSTYHLDRYVLSSTFAHKLYVDILHYGVTPYVTFAQPNIVAPKWAADFKVEVIF
jgi:hypothetical protein